MARCLFDRLVGALLEMQRHVEAERLRGLEVDDSLVFGRCLHRKVGGGPGVSAPSTMPTPWLGAETERRRANSFGLKKSIVERTLPRKGRGQRRPRECFPWFSQRMFSLVFSPSIKLSIPPRLLVLRTDALNGLFANLRIVLCDHQNRCVLFYREALIGDGLHEGIVGLISNTLLVRWGRCLDPLLIILLDSGHLSYGSSSRIEFLVWNVRRLIGGIRRRNLGLGVRCGNKEKPRGG
jgi:hypothetical protein